MKVKKILLIAFLTFFVQISIGQTSHQAFINKVFLLQLKPADFAKGLVFLTLDTLDVSSPSTYLESSRPKAIIKEFKRFVKSTKFITGVFRGIDLINSPFFKSPLHIYFFVNTEKNTFRFELWTDKNDMSKLEGISVFKYPNVLM